ncbi:hypothetical protein BV20DRAFT_269586 [Pilatotrama ljubarskyi]|nr:hypothetical protein BV20DRAFT_269586 [Pilatotrama ljubarskyi]
MRLLSTRSPICARHVLPSSILKRRFSEGAFCGKMRIWLKSPAFEATPRKANERPTEVNLRAAPGSVARRSGRPGLFEGRRSILPVNLIPGCSLQPTLGETRSRTYPAQRPGDLHVARYSPKVAESLLGPCTAATSQRSRRAMSAAPVAADLLRRFLFRSGWSLCHDQRRCRPLYVLCLCFKSSERSRPRK